MQLLTMLLVFSLCLFPNLATAASPHIYDAPQAGPPTSQTQVLGNGWDPNATIDIYFDSTDVGLVDTDNNGSFGMTLRAPTIRQNGLSIQIPKDAVPGQHWITAVERITQLQAQVSFTVWGIDWPQFHYGPDRTGFNPYENVLSPETVGNLTTRWTYRFGDYIYASGSATVADGTVYVSDKWGPVYALDASTGVLRWISPCGGAIYTGPSVVNGVVYSNCFDGVYALDAFTGVTLWSYPVGNSGYGESLAVANGVVYVGSALSNDNDVYALQASTGALLWKYPTGTHYFYASPAVADGVVYVGDYDGNLYALDAGTGALLWKVLLPTGIDAAPVVANGVVYVAPDHSMFALKASTGELIWTYPTNSNIFGSPAVANGVVYVADGNVYALDASTGALLWKYTTDDGMWSSPAMANGVVYVGSLRGNVYALEASTGALLWKYTSGNAVESSPTVVNGILYIGSDDGNFYAFGLPNQQMSEKFSPPERPDPARLTPNWSLQPSQVVTSKPVKSQ